MCATPTFLSIYNVQSRIVFCYSTNGRRIIWLVNVYAARVYRTRQPTEMLVGRPFSVSLILQCMHSDMRFSLSLFLSLPEVVVDGWRRKDSGPEMEGPSVATPTFQILLSRSLSFSLLISVTLSFSLSRALRFSYSLCIRGIHSIHRSTVVDCSSLKLLF